MKEKERKNEGKWKMKEILQFSKPRELKIEEFGSF